MLAILATAGHLSATSLAIGPLKMVPLGLPLLSFKTIAALSSNLILTPSARRYSFFCLTMIAGTTVFLISNLPFLTEANTKSATPADGNLSLVVLCPTTENILNTLAPELSQVWTHAPTGKARVTLLLNAFIFVCILVILYFFIPFILLFI